MTKRLILILASISLVSGCGFALRGNYEMPESLTRIVVVGDDALLVDQLEDTLEKNGVLVTGSDDETAAIINLGEVDYKRDVRTTDSNGLVTSYTLRYIIDYDVTTGEGEELQIDQHLSQSRVLPYDPLLELQSEEEEEFLREEMQEEIVLQILRRLSRI